MRPEMMFGCFVVGYSAPKLFFTDEPLWLIAMTAGVALAVLSGRMCK